MIYLYKRDEETYFVTKNEQMDALAEFEDDDPQFMDLSLDIISQLGVMNAFILLNENTV